MLRWQHEASRGCRRDVLLEEGEHAIKRGLHGVRLVLAHAERLLALHALGEAVEEGMADTCEGSRTSDASQSQLDAS